MVYASYEYYVTNYLGSVITEDAFAAAALRASQFLEYYTRNKVKDAADLEEVKMACCALAEEAQVILQAEAQARQAALSDEGGKLQSQTVGNYSVTYQSGGQRSAELLEISKMSQNRMVDIARRYLANTGLLYRGGGCQCTHLTL